MVNKLEELSLANNDIKFISKNIASKYNWLDFYVNKDEEDFVIKGFEKNPLEYPPNSVLSLGPESVKDYYMASEEYGHAPISEGRIIVVGDGSSGKSSLIQRILYDTFEQGKSQTNGVFIDKLELKHEDDRELSFHIWDFGGQEIQHAVHKFFFTDGCLYILVLDNRKEEEPEYWLQQIESLGGKASVFVVFNKQDDNVTEIADRKFLKEKYPNIVDFYNTSCKTGEGIHEFKKKLEKQVVKLRTVEEQFPNNWFEIKRQIKECTTGAQHYLDYKTYRKICNENNVESEETQKLLLKYFTTIGAVTWFGDTYLDFLHVLSPRWITQGVYKIITSKKTAKHFGKIDIDFFDELLEVKSDYDYTYEKSHHGYILSMMKKFDLCYTSDDKTILIPSAFGKEPKIEYSDYRGEGIRTYILEFKGYMPLALIHRFIAKKLPNVYEDNYWYSGIVVKDGVSDSTSMIYMDKEAKRIYIRIKGDEKLGNWEHIRREFHDITKSYAEISFEELILLESNPEATVTYKDLISHLSVDKPIYFHSGLRKDYNVAYLIGLFENKEKTMERLKNEYGLDSSPTINIFNEINPVVNTNINIEIDLTVVNQLSSSVKGDAAYLIEQLGESNKALTDALVKVIEFTDNSKSVKNTGDVIEKGWGRKLKTVLKTLSKAKEQVKDINDGGEALKAILSGLKDLSEKFNLEEIMGYFEGLA